MVEHRLLQRHRKLLLRLKADGGVELLGVLDRGSSSTRRATRWLASPRRTLLGKLVLGEEHPELLGEALGVDDLTLVEEAGQQALGGRPPENRAVAVPSSAAAMKPGLDVEAHHRPNL